jgi:hypothetical protein
MRKVMTAMHGRHVSTQAAAWIALGGNATKMNAVVAMFPPVTPPAPGPSSPTGPVVPPAPSAPPTPTPTPATRLMFSFTEQHLVMPRKTIAIPMSLPPGSYWGLFSFADAIAGCADAAGAHHVQVRRSVDLGGRAHALTVPVVLLPGRYDVYEM